MMTGDAEHWEQHVPRLHTFVIATPVFLARMDPTGFRRNSEFVRGASLSQRRSAAERQRNRMTRASPSRLTKPVGPRTSGAAVHRLSPDARRASPPR